PGSMPLRDGLVGQTSLREQFHLALHLVLHTGWHKDPIAARRGVHLVLRLPAAGQEQHSKRGPDTNSELPDGRHLRRTSRTRSKSSFDSNPRTICPLSLPRTRTSTRTPSLWRSSSSRPSTCELFCGAGRGVAGSFSSGDQVLTNASVSW